MNNNDLLKEICIKNEEISGLKENIDALMHEKSVTIGILNHILSEINFKKLTDIKGLIAVINQINTYNLKEFTDKICDYLEDMLDCEVSLYLCKSGEKTITDIIAIDDLDDTLFRIYGNDNIFSIYNYGNLMNIETLKELSSFELNKSVIGKNSVGSYLTASNGKLIGFIFFNSVNTVIDKDFLEITSPLISNSLLNIVYVRKLYGKLTETAKSIYTDAITGVYNRRKLDEDKDSDGIFALAMIDVDRFKYINDNYSYAIGDKALIELAETLKEIVDGYEEMEAYRQGGDEFVILYKTKNLDLIENSLKHLQKGFCSKEITEGLKCTLSIGCAYTYGDRKFLFNSANFALHEVKRNGKNNYKIIECLDKIVEVVKEKRVYAEDLKDGDGKC